MPVSIAGNGTLSGVDPAASGFGKILQTVYVGKTDTFTTASTSFVDVTGLSVTITMGGATNKLLIMWSCAIGNSSNATGTEFVITNGSDTILFEADAAGSRVHGTAAWGGGAAADHEKIPAAYSGAVIITPGASGSYTVKGRLRATGGTATFGRNGTDTDADEFARNPATIILMEVAA